MIQRTSSCNKGIYRFRGDIFPVVFILIAGLKFSLALESAIDIGLYDESNYLYMGVNIAKQGLPGPEGAPLYALWYFLLSNLQPDRLKLYYLNYQILTISLPILFYMFMRRWNISRLPAFVVAGYFLISFANLPLWPKPTHFALAIFFVFCIFGSFFPLLPTLSLSALVITYIRPEFFITYAALAVMYFMAAVKAFRSKKTDMLMHFSVFVFLSFLLISILGIPDFFTGKSRSFMAFGQHFSINWVNWKHSNIEPWTNWKSIVMNQFGPVQTFFEALISNPLLFFKHVLFNLINLPITLASLVFAHFPVLLPIQKKSFWISEAIILVLAVFALYIKIGCTFLKEKLKTNKDFFAQMSFFALAPITSAIAIYPRGHYLLFLDIFILTVIAFSIMVAAEKRTVVYRLGLAGVLLIGLTPAMSDFSELPLARSGSLNRKTIIFLKSLNIKEKVNILEAEGGYFIYLPGNYHRIAIEEKGVNFNRALYDRKINMIVLSDKLRNDNRFVLDKQWQEFLNNYSAYGFSKITIPGTKRFLFVKKSLLIQSK